LRLTSESNQETNTMRKLLKFKTLITVLSLGFILTLSAQALAKQVEETFNVSPGGTLDLRTDAGRLIVKTHSRDTVILEAEIEGKQRDDFGLEYKVNGDDVIITGKLEKRQKWGWNSNLRVTFEITVPENYNLELHTSGGSIDIADLEGNIDAHTSGGSIEVGNVTGKVDLHTSGGSITTEDINGPIDAHTSGGSIRTTFAQQLVEDAELNTSGGSITAYLVSDVKIDINASTSGGRVRSEFDIDGRVKKTSVKGEINGGGPKLKLHTSGGSISIKSL
jgi:hypothetical protein